MKSKEDVKMVLTVTSTKIKFDMISKRKEARNMFLSKTCREELFGARVQRLIENLQYANSIPTKISRSVLILPMLSGCECIAREKLLRENRNTEAMKVQQQQQQCQHHHHQQHQQHHHQQQHFHHHQQPTQQKQEFVQNESLDQNGIQFYQHHQNPDYVPEPVYTELLPELDVPQVSYPPCQPSVPPQPSTTLKVTGAKAVNPVPRHRRSSHINAEHRRRSKIQRGFDALKEMIPALSEGCSSSTKDSKSEMLHKTANHVREIGTDMKKQQKEMEELKKEIADLNLEIESFQMRLPATGITTVDKPSCHSKAMYTRYVRERTEEDWKFWLFSFIMKPLFESYNRMVTTSSVPTFIQSVREWSNENLSLVNLRPCILSALRQISLQSCILTHPNKLQDEALVKVKEN